MKLSLKNRAVALAFGLPLLAIPLMGTPAVAQTLTAPVAGSNGITYYVVPIGYTWDHMSYDTNPGDWNIAIGDSGFDAGEIPENPEFCTNGTCPANAGTVGPSFITHNTDATHGYSGIPILIGPTQDGFNNTETGHGQAIPVVPGSYKAAFVTYSGVNGPHVRPIILNYADGSQVVTEHWADWCNAAQAAPDFFTWIAKHRNNGTGQDGNSCALITKYIPLNPNRTLNSITFEYDQNSTSMNVQTGDNGNGGGEVLPGDTLTSGNGRTVIGSLTLVSTNSMLPQYGLVTGHITDASGTVQTTPPHAHVADTGFEVFVLDPPLGNYGAGANIDGSYTLGLPPGTYTLSAAVRGGASNTTSSGPQAKPVKVTVTSGATVKQDIAILAAPDATQWGELMGTVQDASGKPVQGAAILVSDSATGPFTAVGIPGQGLSGSDGTFDIPGLEAGTLYVSATTNTAATTAPVKVTLASTGPASVTLKVAALPIGSILGSVVTPGKNFGGVGDPVTLTSTDGKTVLTATTVAIPLLNGTGHVPEDTETAQFEIDSVPAGTYTLTLTPAANEGTSTPVAVTVATGMTANPVLTLTYPTFTEGTPDTTLTDPLNTATLASKWSTMDVGAPMTAGTTKAATTGLAVTADGAGWDVDHNPDSFTYVYQPAPAGDWVATVTVNPEPTTAGSAGIMVRNATKSSDGMSLEPLASNFDVNVTAGLGVLTQGRVGDFQQTFLFREFAAGTDPTDTTTPGTVPAGPITLKIRKLGSTFAAFYSNDGGKTQHFVGQFALALSATPSLLLGLSTTANASDGSTDSATYTNFTFAPLGGVVTPAVLCGALTGHAKVGVGDATLALRIAVNLATATAAETAAACGHTINVGFATQLLRIAVFGGTITAK